MNAPTQPGFTVPAAASEPMALFSPARSHTITEDGTANISSSEVPADKSNTHQFRLAVKLRAHEKYANKPPVPVTVNAENEVVFVSWASAKHILRDGLPDWKTAIAVLRMEEMMATAERVGDFEKDYRGRKDPSGAYFYESDIVIDGEMHLAHITVRQHSDGRRYYDHLVVEKANPAGLPESGAAGTSSGMTSPTPPYAGFDDNIAPDEGGIKRSAPRFNPSVQPIWNNSEPTWWENVRRKCSAVLTTRK